MQSYTQESLLLPRILISENVLQDLDQKVDINLMKVLMHIAA